MVACQRINALICVLSSGADRCGKTLPTARRNHASKIYHADASARPGIGSDIGNADRMPIIARQPDITNTAMFGARNMTHSRLLAAQLFIPVFFDYS
jgi:hypothetical protein